ncbi:IDEAL domain-containing protein [Clostridium ljungdahlii]|nr:IDEAL domain-containing protein [Clostridium ljungdahlii]
MDISNFVVLKEHKNGDFEYGIKLIPKRAMDKFVDSIFISNVSNAGGFSDYKVSFQKRCGFNTVLNDFKLVEKDFLSYIEFLSKFKSSSFKSSKFKVRNFGEIELTYLQSDMIKISSTNGCNRLFFTISKEELAYYIWILKKVHRENLDNSFDPHKNPTMNPITSLDKKKLYNEILYILIDGALDSNNKELFYSLCNKLKISCWKVN